jgi:hypothetical protein
MIEPICNEIHVIRCLVGSVNKTVLLFSDVCELYADKLSVLNKDENIFTNSITYFEQIRHKFIKK